MTQGLYGSGFLQLGAKVLDFMIVGQASKPDACFALSASPSMGPSTVCGLILAVHCLVGSLLQNIRYRNCDSLSSSLRSIEAFHVPLDWQGKNVL